MKKKTEVTKVDIRELTKNGYNDACKIKGIKPMTIKDMAIFPLDQRKYMLAIHKAITTFEVVNEGWIPDYADSNEPKYFMYWKYVPGSGWVFLSRGLYLNSVSTVGARLVAKDYPRLQHLAKILEKEFQIIMNGK